MPSHNATRRANKNSTSAANVRVRSSRKSEGGHTPAMKNDLHHQYPYPEVESDESNSSSRSNDGEVYEGTTSSEPSAPTKGRSNRGQQGQEDQPHLCNSRPILRPLPLPPQSQPLSAGADQQTSTRETTEACQQERYHHHQQYLSGVPSSAWNNSQSSLARTAASPLHHHHHHHSHQYGVPSYAVPMTHAPLSPHPAAMRTMSGSGFAAIDGGAPHRWGSGTVLTSRDWGQMGALTLYDPHAMAVATPMSIAHIANARTTARGGVDTQSAPFGAGGADESAAAATSVSNYDKHIYDHRGVIIEELERLDAEMLVESRAEAAKSKHRRTRESKEARVPFLAVIRDRPLYNCIRVTNLITFILSIVAALCLFAFAAVIYPARLLLENASEQCR